MKPTDSDEKKDKVFDKNKNHSMRRKRNQQIATKPKPTDCGRKKPKDRDVKTQILRRKKTILASNKRATHKQGMQH